MNYKIRFFDILNCILLGATSISLVLFSNSLTTETHFIETIMIFLESGKGDSSKINIYAVLFALSIVYSTGLIVNSIVDWLSNSVSIKTYFSHYIFQRFIFHGINSSCYIIKMKTNNPKDINSDYPSWLFFSNNPYRILSVLIERISQFKDENILNEYRYLNEFFQGLFYVLIGCLLYISTHILTLPEEVSLLKNINNYLYLTYPLLFVVASILCAILSDFYARKLLKYISALKPIKLILMI